MIAEGTLREQITNAIRHRAVRYQHSFTHRGPKGQKLTKEYVMQTDTAQMTIVWMESPSSLAIHSELDVPIFYAHFPAGLTKDPLYTGPEAAAARESVKKEYETHYGLV